MFIMAITLSPKQRAVVGSFMAIVQLAGAVTAGMAFARWDNKLLASASMAFTGAVMLANRWYFQGWRELHPARQSKNLSRPFKP